MMRLAAIVSGVLAMAISGAASATVLFSDPFQSSSDLDSWSIGHGDAAVVSAPGGGDALTFGALTAGGDIFTNVNYPTTTGSYTLSFNFYGNCGATTQCGFFLGANGATVNNGGWILSDTPYAPAAQIADSNGAWEHVSYTFAGSTIQLFMEDYQDSANAAPDSFYLKDLVLTDDPNGVPNGTLTVGTPEPGTWALLSSGIALAGAVLRRRRSALLAA